MLRNLAYFDATCLQHGADRRGVGISKAALLRSSMSTEETLFLMRRDFLAVVCSQTTTAPYARTPAEPASMGGLL